MSDTPLSDAMAKHIDTGSAESYMRFLAQFRESIVGIVAVGGSSQDTPASPTSGGTLGAGRTTYGDGRLRVLAYADPDVAVRTGGARFNAGLPGEVLLRMAVDDPECDGILVNSATQENSIIISRSTATSLFQQDRPGR